MQRHKDHHDLCHDHDKGYHDREHASHDHDNQSLMTWHFSNGQKLNATSSWLHEYTPHDHEHLVLCKRLKLYLIMKEKLKDEFVDS